MQFSEEQGEGNLIDSYQPGNLVINGVTYQQSLVIDRSGFESWPVRLATEISGETLQLAFERKPDVIIIGTGEKQYFPPADIHLPMLQFDIGIEIMDSAAAARTYNVLVSEGRSVVAAIIV
ncbi:Mth938-like domain-containing protein [Solemya velum gill symbiont]|uniref:Mth938-like domain-containing protein n=1 Tax=Solemya velum gill symbiont TaxID=2340 RepID=UPI0009CC8471|nr:Mth938-like domain-containing protein [Solemya velum gill symbiont]OOY98275.1 hypothetical protein BOW19_09600 [Solemya velum gill symbiont]OOZ00593.1 hypothetical protein BOW20_09260 [Solemya velum gill symbiont]OOZ02767.1 hypothetical protein BOW21_09675 [Solemya velum gill symbiont]OOZ04802.1 hypothetical protein BOW22_09595 [Solemya velum gill symbiont]OOZ07043.1 hypothetical protein BOW23_09600 [Solemya velum gill symbiont]